MARGVEVRGDALRIYFRHEGKTCKEPFPGAPTPENIQAAERLVAVIRHDIKLGVFDYARYFPSSPSLQRVRFGHWLDQWLAIKRGEVAASSIRMYESRAKQHVRPAWGDRVIDLITHVDIQRWVHQDLLPALHSKTAREVLSITRQVFKLYRTCNPAAADPTEGVAIRLPDADDPDPFTREEIRAILETPAPGRDQEINLAKFMLWSGPRVSEAIALAWEDVDLDKGTVTFQRARVCSSYRVTKTRRSKRKVSLLKPALEALRAQAALTMDLPPVEIEVTDRDNRTVRKREVRFVFHSSATGAAYSTADNLRVGFWALHLKRAGVRYRGPNTCRHTYASQLLSSGAVSVEWIGDQMGHTSTAMVHRHYGKWISVDAPDMTGMVERRLNL